MKECPFCQPDQARLCYQGRLIYGLWDGFPVTPGHCLLIPRRHIRDWWEADPQELAELAVATQEIKKLIEQRHSPDGYNIGVNVGEAGGQSVWHLHLHILPRYLRDVDNARGGIRNLLARKTSVGN